MLNNVAETIIFVFYKKGSLSEEIKLNNDYGFFNDNLFLPNKNSL